MVNQLTRYSLPLDNSMDSKLPFNCQLPRNMRLSTDVNDPVKTRVKSNGILFD